MPIHSIGKPDNAVPATSAKGFDGRERSEEVDTLAKRFGSLMIEMGFVRPMTKMPLEPVFLSRMKLGVHPVKSSNQMIKVHIFNVFQTANRIRSANHYLHGKENSTKSISCFSYSANSTPAAATAAEESEIYPSSPSLSSSPAPKSKTSGAAKKKNKKKAAQARQLDSINHLDHLNDHIDSNGLIGRSDMIGAYPAEDAVSITQRTTTGSISPDEDQDDRITSHTMHPSLAAATRQTQEDLLATANDLYRQIESAAAAALATTQYPKSSNSILNSNNSNQSSTHHQSGHSNSNNHSPHPDDDAYWTSLPAHLRSFIRSALPLAAGHSSSNSNQSQSSAQNPGAILPNLSSFAHATGMVTSTTTSNNSQSVPQLTSEQMAAAANNWLESFKVTIGVERWNGHRNYTPRKFYTASPLHAHAEQHQHQNSHGMNEPVYYTGETTIVTSRIGDKHNGDDGLLDDGYYSDDARGMRGDINHSVLDNRHNHSEQASNASNIGANAGTNEAVQPSPVPSVDIQRSSPALPSNPVASTKASAQLNPSTRKPGLDPPGVHLANQALSPNPSPPHRPSQTPTQITLPIHPQNGRDSSFLADTQSRGACQPRQNRERCRIEKNEGTAAAFLLCAVCGRKRLAIEQELEVLYDAYYDELENYAEASKKYYGSDLKTKGTETYLEPTQPSTQTPSKKAVPKPTRDHKNIRPRPQQAALQQTHPPTQSTNGTNGHYQQPAAKRTLPPPAQLKKLNSHNSNSDHDHTHSPSCPHHPHHHGPNHYHPSNRGKGVANAHCIPPAGHQRTHQRSEDAFPDEDAEEEDDEDEYDDEDEEEYDEVGPITEEVPSEPPVQNNAHKKPPINGTNMPYPNKVTNGDKTNSTHANNSDLFGFGNSLTVKGGILTVADDLLRNDGQKFLEMMESLADKRIQRERDAAENLLAGLEDEKMTGTTTMKTMSCTRKAGQLLRELEDEDRLPRARAQKGEGCSEKKEKKKAQKQQKDQDLAKKLKDKEAEEQAAKAAEEARLEAESRKLQEAERAKKDEERKKRIEEESKKRKEKEEKIRLEKEARIAKERKNARREEGSQRSQGKEELARKKKAETAKREAEEAAKREAAKTAAAKLAAQNKNVTPNAKTNQRTPISVRSPMTPKPINTSIKMPPNSSAHNVPMPNPAFPPHTPNRPMMPPPMLSRQMSVGIGLGRPASAAAAPPFSAAVPPMAGPSSYSNIPARPPSAQYSTSFPASNAYAPPGCLQNIPPDMHMPMNGIQGLYLEDLSYRWHNYVNQTPQPHQATQQHRHSIDESLIQGGFLSNSIEPIGRPKMNGNSNLMEVLSGQSDRDSTPGGSVDTSPTRNSQNVLGSSALLADDEEAGATSLDDIRCPPIIHRRYLGYFLTCRGSDSGWGAAVLSTPPPAVATPRTPSQPSTLSGVQPNYANSNAHHPQQQQQQPRENTSDWIRRRAISAYCNMRLNEKWIPVGDVSIEMQRIHLDTLNVNLKDMVDACLIKRNIHNGGGDWQFSQQGSVLYTRWLPVSSTLDP
ncbi:hypothetical protein KEM48_010649 [Puccinia striiformis f. sp. tritici PST-130]|nr:hypothetical protein KEM48_010649 [Puccinia striiformis f. sp. tritici PST-130]